MMTMNVSQEFDSIIIAKLREQLETGDEKLNIQPYEVVVEKEVSNNNLDLKYDLGERRNMRPLETALGNNDVFILTHIALGIYKEPVLSDGSASPANASGNAVLFHFPDPNMFDAPATTTSLSEASCLEALYNGSMECKADQDEILLELKLRRFRKVPYFQYSPGPPVTLPSYEGQEYQKMHIPVLFDGNKSNRFVIAPAQGADMSQAAGLSNGKNVVQVRHRGYIIRDFAESATIEMIKRQGAIKF